MTEGCHWSSLSGVISPFFSSSISGIYWCGESSFTVLSFCLFIPFMGFSRQEYWSGLHSLLQWTTFCETSPPWPCHLGWLHTAWHSSFELDRLWSMWLDWLVVCDCGFNVSALWCPLSAPTILLGVLLPLRANGIPVELFQILEDDAVKVLPSVCQQMLSSGHRTGKGQFSFQSQRKQCQRKLKLPHNCIHLTC